MRKYFGTVFFFILMGCSENMVEFKPIIKSGDSYIVSESNIDSNFVKGLEKVFSFYEVAYIKKDDNTILINASLYSDTDLMYNYTKKAEDIEWQRTH